MDPDARAVPDSDPRPNLAATIGPLVESGLDPRETIAMVARLGYVAVQWPATLAGLRPRDLDTTARRGVRDLCRRFELRVSGVDAWIPPGHFLDRERVDRAIAATHEAIRFAADCAEPGRERPVVSILLPERPRAGAAAENPAGESGLADVAAALAEESERAGVALADHAVSRRSFAGIGVGIDPAAVLAAGGDPCAAVAASGRDLVSARIVDLLLSGLRGPIGEPGELRLDLLRYRIAIELSGLRQTPVVDARQWREPAVGLDVSLRRWAGETGHPFGA